MDPYQNQGWTGSAWNPAQHGYRQQNDNWPQQPQPPLQPQLPPSPQYIIQPAPQIFCCENCQRVAPSTPVNIHAYTTRLAFFVNHILHPTVATYAQVPNRGLHPDFFDMAPVSRVVPATGGHGQSDNNQGQQHGGQQGNQYGFQLQAPSRPAANAITHYTAANGAYNNNHQLELSQQGGHQSSGVYAQNNTQLQLAHNNRTPNNQPSQAVMGPIMFAGSSYSIAPSIPIPLPRFIRPNFQLNVKFRLERFRLDPPAPHIQYGNPHAHGFSPYQLASPFNTLYQNGNTNVNSSTKTTRARENMELIWFYWPIQLEIPLWARGQNTQTSAPEIVAQLVKDGMQIINGERWGFIQDAEEREGLWHKRRSYKVLECPIHGMLWKVTVFVRRGY
ncbi:57260caa-4362-4677-bd0e-034b17c12a2d-CDS [Sclerotinia trifoliorum]|uniref:57260caa-4362-4677-bd0e-034b17c12a2d-CDS n=1 Tax=Sclerotinia trifoliorum TaxID=28548 RepID=A0A8H2ZYA2_9HELO|nr:57260caa-4362-4677-bd0e-034b17c12a2d-CDS [Sclerotinia trifoliorum]